MPLTLQDMVLVVIRFMVFRNYVGWSKLIFISIILCKPTLNNDYMKKERIKSSPRNPFTSCQVSVKFEIFIQGGLSDPRSVLQEAMLKAKYNSI